MRKVLRTAVLGSALVLSACGGRDDVAAPTSTTAPPASSTTTPVGNPPELKITPVGALQQPTAMAQRSGDDAMFFTELGGKVRVMRSGAVDAVPVVDLQDELGTGGERGLLGIAFSPTNPALMYLDYTDKSGAVRVTEFTVDSNYTVDLHNRRDLLTVPHSENNNHNGGQLAFGPDGKLYIGIGDGGGQGDQQNNAQNLTVLLGKILRIDPTPNGTQPYTIPYDNPFVKQSGARGEIWAYGLRNPWRFSFDSVDGQDRGIWIADVGQNKWEEIDHIDADAKGGQNYGWSLREATHEFKGDKPTNAVDPLYEYSHDDGRCSVTGGYVYRGKAIPGMYGRYVFGDFCTGELMALTQKGTQWEASDLHVKANALQSFAVDHNGEQYVLGADGNIGRIDGV